MKLRRSSANRRQFLQQLAFTAAAFTTPGLLAEELTRTKRQTEGPFYPNKLPLDTDNDLLILNDSLTPAVGEVTHLGGKILDPNGNPVRNAVVEIWQVDNVGAYIHTKSAKWNNRDTHFQGFGRFLTGSSGEYYFRTIKPVAYEFRTPHIHVAVNKDGKRMLTTQLYVKGEPKNQTDPIFRSIRNPKALETVVSEFVPISDSRAGELKANFDIVLGLTPEDAEVRQRRGRFRPGSGRRENRRSDRR